MRGKGIFSRVFKGGEKTVTANNKEDRVISEWRSRESVVIKKGKQRILNRNLPV